MEEDIKQFIKEEGKKTRDHFDVVAEDLKGQIQQVAEGVVTNTERLDRLGDVPEKLDKIDGRLTAIETTFEAVNLPILKQQVADLLKRVTFLEAKFSQ
jgi:predicted metal-dependent hydrolase